MRDNAQSAQQATTVAAGASAVATRPRRRKSKTLITEANMEPSTQQNAALVEEASAAAESLREQAGPLVVGVDKFTLSNGASTAYERTAGVAPRWTN
ncbi:MAG: hypothetical protein ABIU95_02780 [Burkholderiales bacterium]